MLRKLNRKQTIAEKFSKVLLKPNEERSDEESDSSDIPRVADFDEDYFVPDGQSSEFRKRNIKLLSEQSKRYRGKIVSRSALKDSDEDDYDDEKEDDLKEESSSEENTQLGQSDDEDDSNDDDSKAAEQDDSEKDSESVSDEGDNANEEVTVEVTKNAAAEVQRGLSVQNELRIWEKLLELRIQMQKVLTKSNALPTSISNDDDEDQLKTETAVSLCNLLEKLATMKDLLTSQYPELKKTLASEKKGKKRKSFCYDVSLGASPIKRIGEQLENDFQTFRPYRSQVLVKWDERTRVTRAANKSNEEEFDILNKIENALQNRKSLIERSQTIKSGKDDEIHVKETNKNVYDDSDFYHHQLRELIEYKTNTSANMLEVTKQYAELQKLRQKMKKTVDTKASKGRKLRYVVHKKLVNFMAPKDTTTWTEEARNELYKSLFAAS